ncbi:site-specific DNA-methyltransferase [Roseomonas genomospecies 6]|uniref:site-specific DNA-methyltransferase (adenine-specific) n=1 Tax=Roseomonas genomospecies 6 TaxID=214106 RepID=A0A9W7KNP9_9PROT|nr:site-specific DNA-methyltransferase [Roseomonas genomospecies 6]KAA0676357.1 site-specific DNA-methyltransferase [Roseomonas genomospecies 6]
MSRKQKLELTWIGKEERPRLEPRILVQSAELSHFAATRKAGDIFDNMLIHGDNLLALKALETEFRGKIRCIYIDPPYNTGSAFEHYDDGVEHSLWLSLMRDRLEILKLLLSDNGSIWINIDDNEAHYLKVLCDEVFGRRNFIANIVWQKRASRENRAAIGSSHDHILVYAKCPPSEWKNYRNKLPPSDAGFGNPDNDSRGPWRSIPFTAQGYRPNQMYKITTPTGNVVDPPKGRCWGATEPAFNKLLEENRVYFPRGGDSRPRIKQFMGEEDGLVPSTWWTSSEFGDNEDAKKEILALFPDREPFGTPKPERLMERIIQIASSPGDIVLDSFAGSGTTGAVAHKLGRRWILVELGDHAVTHIAPRLKKVINGEDDGGATKDSGWSGGGGFRFLRLAPSLLTKDKWGNWVVSSDYNQAMLAESMCKHMGYTYSPSQEASEYWKHGYSTERGFIYVTAQALTHSMLEAISRDVGPDHHLLVCCKAFSGNPEQFENLTVRKIPQAVLANCEWGRDDYSLRIASLPVVEDTEPEEPKPAPKKVAKNTKAQGTPTPSLFDEPAETEA